MLTSNDVMTSSILLCLRIKTFSCSMLYCTTRLCYEHGVRLSVHLSVTLVDCEGHTSNTTGSKVSGLGDKAS